MPALFFLNFMESGLVRKIWEIAEPLVTHEGMEIVDIEYQREGRGTVLRVYLDREGGVTLGDLAPFSHRLSDVLDSHDVIPGAYLLELSSPGVNRRLRKPDHFKRYVGETVRVRAARPLDGRRSFRGPLRAVEEGAIVVECEGASHRIPFENIAQANYEFDFEAPSAPKGRIRDAGR